MTSIDIAKEFSPNITSSELGELVYKSLLERLNNDQSIDLDFSGVNSVTTMCSKKIFGKLYYELGEEKFYSAIKFKNVNEDVKVIIYDGISGFLSDKIKQSK